MVLNKLKPRKAGICAAFLSLLFLGACAGDLQFRTYVINDRLQHDVLTRHYVQLLDGSNISEQDKATHMGRLEAKEQQISAAEQLLGIKR